MEIDSKHIKYIHKRFSLADTKTSNVLFHVKCTKFSLTYWVLFYLLIQAGSTSNHCLKNIKSVSFTNLVIKVCWLTSIPSKYSHFSISTNEPFKSKLKYIYVPSYTFIYLLSYTYIYIDCCMSHHRVFCKNLGYQLCGYIYIYTKTIGNQF